MPDNPMARLWNDPNRLAAEAKALFETSYAVQPGESLAEAAIRRAYEIVSPDLYVIEQFRAAGVEPNYQSLFSKAYDDKLGALVFLTKRKLLDIEHASVASRDTDDARRDLASYVEILFRLSAVEALREFFDFATGRDNSRVPALWRNVASRCLYLMSLIQEGRDRVLAFLKDRPEARAMVDDLMNTTREEIARIFHALMRDYHAVGSGEDDAGGDGGGARIAVETPYLVIARQFEKEAPEGIAIGYTATFTALERIQQAARQADLPSLLNWIASGTPASMESAFEHAMSVLPTEQYVEVMEMALQKPDLDEVRKSAVILELGSLNRSIHAHGGSPLVNRVLSEVALAANEESDGLARLAARELASCKALGDLHHILEIATNRAVATEALDLLVAEGMLPSVQSIMRMRPELEPAYENARRHYLNLQSLMDSACACRSVELATIYLDRLREYKAERELKQVSTMQNDIGELAGQLVADLQAERRAQRRDRAVMRTP